jgi:hypothetical protein
VSQPFKQRRNKFYSDCPALGRRLLFDRATVERMTGGPSRRNALRHLKRRRAPCDACSAENPLRQSRRAAWRLQQGISSIQQTARMTGCPLRIGRDQCAAAVLANQPLSQVLDAYVQRTPTRRTLLYKICSFRHRYLLLPAGPPPILGPRYRTRKGALFNVNQLTFRPLIRHIRSLAPRRLGDPQQAAILGETWATSIGFARQRNPAIAPRQRCPTDPRKRSSFCRRKPAKPGERVLRDSQAPS